MKTRYNRLAQSRAVDREREQLCQRCETLIASIPLSEGDIFRTFPGGEILYADPRTWDWPQLRRFLAAWTLDLGASADQPAVTWGLSDED